MVATPWLWVSASTRSKPTVFQAVAAAVGSAGHRTATTREMARARVTRG
jgi:hypothetical protein